MSFVNWVSLTVIGMLANIVFVILTPFAVLFVTNDEHLPKWLSWLDTPDNKLAAQIADRPFPEHDTRLKRYVNYVFWLCRNRGYGLSETVLGFTVEPGFTYSCIGDEAVGNKPLHEGLVRRYLTSGGTTYWQWYYIKAWGPAKWRRCIRINMGWKLWGNPQAGDRISIVCSPSPWQGYLRG